VPRHKRSDLMCEPMQFTGDLQGQKNLTFSDSQHLAEALLEWSLCIQLQKRPEKTSVVRLLFNSLRPPLKTKNVAGAPGAGEAFAIPTDSVQPTMVHSLANQKVWYRTDGEEGPQHSSQADRS
jgi:hypothetical protein